MQWREGGREGGERHWERESKARPRPIRGDAKGIHWRHTARDDSDDEEEGEEGEEGEDDDDNIQDEKED